MNLIKRSDLGAEFVNAIGDRAKAQRAWDLVDADTCVVPSNDNSAEPDFLTINNALDSAVLRLDELTAELEGHVLTVRALIPHTPLIKQMRRGRGLRSSHFSIVGQSDTGTGLFYGFIDTGSVLMFDKEDRSHQEVLMLGSLATSAVKPQVSIEVIA